MSTNRLVWLLLPLLFACKRDTAPLESVVRDGAEPRAVQATTRVEPEAADVSERDTKGAEPVASPSVADGEQEVATGRSASAPPVEVEPEPVELEKEVPETLRCKRDEDCVVMPPRPCSCPPCGDVWREAMNREAFAAWEERWATRRCKRPVCTECEGRYLGTKAVCRAGRCTVDRSRP
jgi:hypothetical protein